MKKNNGILEFLKSSTDAYHAVEAIRVRLLSEGYTELFENDNWSLKDGGKYFVIRGGASLIVFNYTGGKSGFMITASHTDSPTFKLKPSLETCGAYTRLDTEKYGSTIHYSWLDRPLSVSGRVTIKTEKGIKTRLINIDRDLLVIPSVAIHLKSSVNSGIELNPASDMLPLLTSQDKSGALLSLIASEAGAAPGDILSHDLYLYNRQAPTYIGAESEYILSPRFDDLGCVYTALEGFLMAEESAALPVLAVFDHEEIGSSSAHGAASSFLHDVLSRMAGDSLDTMLADSLMLSIDVAHAKHPAHPELSDPNNAPILNGGIAVKHNANQRYTTNAESAALIRMICDRAGVPSQSFASRADMPCGSTLGTVACTKVAVLCADIGLPQLAMHSACETAGAHDIAYMISALKLFYSSSIKREGNDILLNCDKA